MQKSIVQVSAVILACAVSGCDWSANAKPEGTLPTVRENSTVDEEELKRVRRALERVKPRLLEREIRESHEREKGRASSEKAVH